MELAQWFRSQTQAEEAAPPEVATAAPDAHDLYGNAFLLGFLGPKPEKARTGVADAAQAMADRAQARIELQQKLSTTGEEGKATVSEEELDELTAMYSDIRRGTADLSLDTSGMSPEDAAAFRASAMDDIGDLLQTESGRRLVRDLAYNEKDRKTRIGAQEGEGAKASARLPADADCRESYARDRLGDQAGWCVDDHKHDGTGVDSRVGYRPGQDQVTPHEGAIRSDVVLYHELTHALHNTRGDQAHGGVPSAVGGHPVDNDEFQATGLGRWAYVVGPDGELVPNENLYRAERRDLGEDLPDRPTYGGTAP